MKLGNSSFKVSIRFTFLCEKKDGFGLVLVLVSSANSMKKSLKLLTHHIYLIVVKYGATLREMRFAIRA